MNLCFVLQASYWSTKRHELFGTVSNKESSVQLNLFGKWSEALYVGKAPSAKCIWRPGAENLAFYLDNLVVQRNVQLTLLNAFRAWELEIYQRQPNTNILSVKIVSSDSLEV